ncbi:E3 ubiquitin protein ligase DRIP2 [Glycine soja]|uniref:E3 ubiquitin protein ligase DRIP2 n=1 Tax=Glycine soja TaxID=3848 RepID=A0A0B2Q030_GLYSO|nr:E3 ubiquitin protein ligase DRIP2 [Glycine soja]
MVSSSQVVKVKRNTLRPCMTCPLCHKFFKDATTISLCLHTFCRKCIYEKLSDEEMDCCPVCHIDLGCLPVEKLRKGDFPLPQISACYLRIKDGTVPVSFIQKYLMKKLNLASEAEVEIMCRGQPVLPSLQLHNLVDLWFRTASTSKKIPASVGSSAKDFVMVLSYCRKALPP